MTLEDRFRAMHSASGSYYRAVLVVGSYGVSLTLAPLGGGPAENFAVSGDKIEVLTEPVHKEKQT